LAGEVFAIKQFNQQPKAEIAAADVETVIEVDIE